MKMAEAPIVVQPVCLDDVPASPMAHVQLRPPIVVQPVSEDSLKGFSASPMAVAHVQLRPNKPVSLESQIAHLQLRPPRRPFPLEQTLGASQAKSTSFLGTKAESTADVRVARLVLQCTQYEGLCGLRARCDGLFVMIWIALILSHNNFRVWMWQWTHTGNLSTGQLNWTLAQVDTCSCSTRILHLLNSKWTLAQLEMDT